MITGSGKQFCLIDARSGSNSITWWINEGWRIEQVFKMDVVAGSIHYAVLMSK